MTAILPDIDLTVLEDLDFDHDVPCDDCDAPAARIIQYLHGYAGTCTEPVIYPACSKHAAALYDEVDRAIQFYGCSVCHLDFQKVSDIIIADDPA